jgi:hypothetical protein
VQISELCLHNNYSVDIGLKLFTIWEGHVRAEGLVEKVNLIAFNAVKKVKEQLESFGFTQDPMNYTRFTKQYANL